MSQFMSPYYNGFQSMFKDFPMFIRNLEKALNGERSAIDYYAKLMELAPNEDARRQVEFARNDEMKHFLMFTQLYISLTGRQPVVTEPTVQIASFCSGVRVSIQDELEAHDLYRDMYISTSSQQIRDIMFEALSDEIEHATRYNYVYSAYCVRNPLVGTTNK